MKMRTRDEVKRAIKARTMPNDSGCWVWQGPTDKDGYGKFCSKFAGLTRYAHRISYIVFVGAIPDGLTLDHLCRVRACVNPAHLDPVTHCENVLRGFSPGAVHARKTHCDHGHLFDRDNTYTSPNGGRVCRACNLRAVVAYKARKAIA